MAQDIVSRTMRIIDTNINVMDARGRIIGSGDRERIGELHEGALLVLSQGRVVDIDNELARPLARLKSMDNNGLLRRTLAAWFRHNVQPLATSKALFIHRNTLEYRLNRISKLTGLDLGNFDDRLLLYVALQLDEQR
ncbi:helix-turn-helix domain-containing protein [Citrobacter sp. R56]|uniref:helix-turn-helix domain-containing protein n=1 Tax=Citrobacter sp. R56 TaxID=1573676 RepID=UPI00193B22EB|nr:helix-turn-helix domain-containing protein [Citrobacter sp. R56]QRG78384.1 helix-turn-helix domain-containing protein [Citrobacter sp. R56]